MHTHRPTTFSFLLCNKTKHNQITFTDGAEPEETNWVSRSGSGTATYADGSTFEGTFDEEKLKQGKGKYTWMGPGGEDGEETVVIATYEGEYKDGLKEGR